jgi:hypothetical protein
MVTYIGEITGMWDMVHSEIEPEYPIQSASVYSEKNKAHRSSCSIDSPSKNLSKSTSGCPGS